MTKKNTKNKKKVALIRQICKVTCAIVVQGLHMFPDRSIRQVRCMPVIIHPPRPVNYLYVLGIKSRMLFVWSQALCPAHSACCCIYCVVHNVCCCIAFIVASIVSSIAFVVASIVLQSEVIQFTHSLVCRLTSIVVTVHCSVVLYLLKLSMQLSMHVCS